MIARSRSSSLLSDRERLLQGIRLARPALVQGRGSAPVRSRDSAHVGVDLLEADLDVPPADPPAAGDVVLRRTAR